MKQISFLKHRDNGPPVTHLHCKFANLCGVWVCFFWVVHAWAYVFIHTAKWKNNNKKRNVLKFGPLFTWLQMEVLQKHFNAVLFSLKKVCSFSWEGWGTLMTTKSHCWCKAGSGKDLCFPSLEVEWTQDRKLLYIKLYRETCIKKTWKECKMRLYIKMQWMDFIV